MLEQGCKVHWNSQR